MHILWAQVTKCEGVRRGDLCSVSAFKLVTVSNAESMLCGRVESAGPKRKREIHAAVAEGYLLQL